MSGLPSSLKDLARVIFPETYAKVSGEFRQDQAEIFAFIERYRMASDDDKRKKLQAFKNLIDQKLQDPNFDINATSRRSLDPRQEEINGRSGYQHTILHAASNFPELIEFVLSKPQTNPNVRDSSGFPPIYTPLRSWILFPYNHGPKRETMLYLNDPRTNLEIVCYNQRRLLDVAYDEIINTHTKTLDEDDLNRFIYRFPDSIAKILIEKGAKIENTDSRFQGLFWLIRDRKLLQPDFHGLIPFQ